jgi:hypothetical protein
MKVIIREIRNMEMASLAGRVAAFMMDNMRRMKDKERVEWFSTMDQSMMETGLEVFNQEKVVWWGRMGV